MGPFLWNMNRFLCLVLLAGSMTACRSTEREAGPDRRRDPLDKILSEAVPLFTEYVFPNSMARLPGFDINAHLGEVDSRRKALTAGFHTPEGVRFLADRIGSEQDEVAAVCILKILSESGMPEARPVLERYALHENYVIRSNARGFLGR
jgi:hypothetical protein